MDMLAVVAYRYISTNSEILGGEPILRGTRTPVRAIVELWRAGISPEEIPVHLPHLSLAQIFDALGYYADNRSEIQRYIESNRVPDHLIHPTVRPTIRESE